VIYFVTQNVILKPTVSVILYSPPKLGEAQYHLQSKAAFSLLFSLLSFLWKRQFERREKNEKRKVKRTKRNDNLLSKIVVSFWQG